MSFVSQLFLVEVRFATVATNFTTTVKQTERTSEAAHAFDYTFTGTLGVMRMA